MLKFTADIQKFYQWTLIQLPNEVSKKLPSRGQVMMNGAINGQVFNHVIEPDGRMGHWIKLNDALLKELSVTAGDSVTVEIEPTKEWPEPKVPKDLQTALNNAPADIQELWKDITPMARWEWVRWIESTNVVKTRERRVEVAISKMDNGKRRPCCFNLASCTDPDLSKSGKLVIS